MSPFLRIVLRFSTRPTGLSCTPTQLPLQKILLFELNFVQSTSTRFSISFYSKYSKMSSCWQPTETTASNERFLTNPQDCPSGVSAGHSIPQCVLCSYLGFGNFPVLANGAFSLLQCERVEKKFYRFSTYATPVFLFSWGFDQFPVANEY